MNEAVIELNSVGFTYVAKGLTFTALKDVSLRIRAGEFVAIIGPSGSGKSTLLNLLGLLARPSTGTMSIFSEPVESLNDSQLAKLRNQALGFVFQNFSLVSRLTVVENILLPSTFEGDLDSQRSIEHRKKALALLTRFGLDSLADRLPHELSGGQKQRVAICRALLMNPVLLLADEPTGALDSKSSQEVLAMLDDLHREGCTVIIITHDPDVAARAQRIVSIRDGQIAQVEEQGALPREGAKEIVPTKRNFFSEEEKGWKGKQRLIVQSLLMARRSLATHRSRSLLTGLGLFIGILSLIIIDGLGEIVQNSFNKLFFTSSVRKAFIYYDADRGGFHGARHSAWRGLHAQDEFPKLAQMFEKKGIIRPFLRTSICQIKSPTGTLRARLSGVSDPAEFIEMDTLLRTGRWPSAGEFSAGSTVAVLGSDTVEQLFDKADPRRMEANFPVGQRLVVDNCNTLGTFTVIGVLNKRDTTFGNREANDVLYVPNNTLLARMGPTFYSWFSVLPNEGIDTRNLAQEITTYLSLQSGGRLTFGSAIPADILDRVRGFLWIIQAIVGFIGGLCLFVGGVGIMNMMLVTVAERTREIGLLKSLGAQNNHVRAYILTESVLLCFWAGCLAVCTGFVANNLFSFGVSSFVPMLREFRWVFAPLGLSAGLLVSLACGLGFGALPAARAASLDPAECLRAE